MAATATPFLMFQGRAEEAMSLYCALVPGTSIEAIQRFPAEAPNSGGKVMMARLNVRGQAFMVNDSMVGHGFTFTPSFSIYVECADIAELDAVFAGLADGGKILMGLDNYGFSPRFGWVQDRFDISWQLNFGGLSLG